MKRDADHIHKDTRIKSVDMIRVIKIICVVGRGTEEDPNRHTTQYWSENGELLAIADPARDGPGSSHL